MSLSNTTVDFLHRKLSRHPGTPLSTLHAQPVSGGSINDTYRLVTPNHPGFFLKRNDATRYPGLLDREKNSLQFLAAQRCIALPSVVFCGLHGPDQLLVLEWIDTGPHTTVFWQRFGEQLARLHRCTSDRFGFSEDNDIGSLPQVNTPTESWTAFFIRCRLAPQVSLAAEAKLLPPNVTTLFEQLYARMDQLFNTEPPSLLHGDLWSGNFLCNMQSEPVLIDPAVYYGHRSMDLAMTTLFGGFHPSFYEAYHYHFPLPTGYREQWEVCNLYPLLVHLNLFGQHYLSGIMATLKKFT